MQVVLVETRKEERRKMMSLMELADLWERDPSQLHAVVRGLFREMGALMPSVVTERTDGRLRERVVFRCAAGDGPQRLRRAADVLDEGLRPGAAGAVAEVLCELLFGALRVLAASKTTPTLPSGSPKSTDVVVTFGKHEGRTLGWLGANDPLYLDWLAGLKGAKGLIGFTASQGGEAFASAVRDASAKFHREISLATGDPG